MKKNLLKLFLIIIFLGLIRPQNTFAQTITGFSPSSITAGTGSVLTINGSGFGISGPDSTKYVEFTGASVGIPLVKALPSDYISWSDTQIRVKVTFDSGTGIIRIVNGNSTIIATSSLTVSYNLENLSNGTSMRLINDNNAGGYTFQMSSNFNANTSASESFTRALKTWKCATGVNWNIGSVTTTNIVADDGINLIKFAANSGELDVGLLGQTHYFGHSWDSSGRFEISGIDIVFANVGMYNLNFGPAAPIIGQYDFETVALHELGHAHGLGHVNDVADVMHATIPNGATIRSLNTNDINAANYVMTNSISGFSPMVALPTGSCNEPAPIINSFMPTTGSQGTTVTINGANFTEANSVSFGNTPASSFSIVSDSIITAVVAIGTSGNINISTPGGITTIPGFTFKFKTIQNSLVTAPNINYAGLQTFKVGITIAPLVPNNSGGAVPATIYGQTTTIAGSETISGSANGIGTTATFYQPVGIATDINGNIYVADSGNNLIRQITPTGIVTTFAGNGTSGSANGTTANATFDFPVGLAVDASNNIYVADFSSGKIRIITKAGIVSNKPFNGINFFPTTMAIDSTDNIYIADNSNNLIRKITTAGAVITLAGSGGTGSTNGASLISSFNQPNGVAVDAKGNIYVADTHNNLIRKISPAGLVTTLAGSGIAGSADGVGTSASFNQPIGLAVDLLRNIYVADQANGLIRKITQTGLVSTISGNGDLVVVDGVGIKASFFDLTSIAVDLSGNVFVTDYNTIRKITTTGYTISPALPPGLTFDATTGIINGIPTSVFPTTSYSITAYNAGGSNTTNVSITVSLQNQAITFAVLPTKANGDADFDPGATINSGLPISYVSSNTSTATIVNGKIHIIGPGTTIITAVQGGNSDFSPALNVSQTLTVIPVPTISANGSTTFFTGASVILTASTGAGYTYAWTKDGTDISGKTGPTYTATLSGSYTVSIIYGSNRVTSAPVTINAVFDLPSTNFKLTITSATCRGNSDGSINITATQSLSYTATITGNGLNTAYPFTTSKNISGLAAGTYSVCITVSGQSGYQQCYDVVITQPADLSVYATVSNSNNTINLALTGGTQYNITLNGIFYTTTDNTITLPLQAGDNDLVVTTDKFCQGTVEKHINISSKIVPYPNPFQNTISLNLGINVMNNVSIEVYNLSYSKLYYSKKYGNQSGVLQIDLSSLENGVYALKLISDNSEKIFKIVKQ